ncbi:MAG: MaoC family dehydratase [Deltaproteobacteria bacterium]|nr:MaoC family dehydratase [Deltaproteobacteria bacterium]
MSDDAQARFRAELDALVGKPVGPAGPQLAPDEVNVPMIRHWADAMEDRNPFLATLATNSEFHVERYVRPGERISATTVIDAISDEKKTAIGRGHFVPWITTYRDDAGEVVGRQLFRLLKFKPEAREGAPS